VVRWWACSAAAAAGLPSSNREGKCKAEFKTLALLLSFLLLQLPPFAKNLPQLSSICQKPTTAMSIWQKPTYHSWVHLPKTYHSYVYFLAKTYLPQLCPFAKNLSQLHPFAKNLPTTAMSICLFVVKVAIIHGKMKITRLTIPRKIN